VQEVGYKRRPLFAPAEYRDLRVENSLYLKLANEIPDDAVVEVANATRWPSAFRFVGVNKSLRYSPAIHVNQEGYPLSGPKRAIVGYYCGNIGQLPLPTEENALGLAKLINAATGAEVATLNPITRNDVGGVASPQYQKLLEVNFDNQVQPGEYSLRVEGLGLSFPFRIDNATPMKLARTYALGLFHQRCGAAKQMPFTRFTHGACHTARASIPVTSARPFDKAWGFIATAGTGANPYQYIDLPDYPKLTSPLTMRYRFGVNQRPEVQVINGQYTIDTSGGHHDAGDYSKYTINSAHLIHTLVFAADNFAYVGDLDNLGLPESGDGLSDILQAAQWEADFLLKMQDNGTLNASGQAVTPGAFYTLVYPRDREYEGDVLPDQGDPQIVWPKTTSVTAAAVAALAEIGSSPKFCQQFSLDRTSPERWTDPQKNKYLVAALKGWDFLVRVIEIRGKRGSFQTLYHYGDVFLHNDELAWAAAAMFAAGYSTPNDLPRDPHSRLRVWYPDPTSNNPIPNEFCDTNPNAPRCDDGDPSTPLEVCDHAPCRSWKWGWWRLHEGYGCAIRNYAFAVRSQRLSGGLDAQYLSNCESAITAWGNIARDWALKTDDNDTAVNAYGTALIGASTGYSWRPHFFFSSSWAFEIAVSDRVQTAQADRDANRAALVESLSFEAGRNPHNVGFVPGLGWKRPRAVVSQYAWNDDPRLTAVRQSGWQHELSVLCAFGRRQAQLPARFNLLSGKPTGARLICAL
jgi:hypothetical protein